MDYDAHSNQIVCQSSNLLCPGKKQSWMMNIILVFIFVFSMDMGYENGIQFRMII
jgi:hypothetical protein